MWGGTVKRWFVLTACVALAVSGVIGVSRQLPGSGARAALTPPANVIVFLTDDQRFDTLYAMPALAQELASRGVTFDRAYATTPHCCPSRVSILTGLYAHHHGVLRNRGGRGGWRAFNDSETLATWLQVGGVRTLLLGKYLNGYESDRIPPGWDDWFAILDNGIKYRRYTVNRDGELNRYGSNNSAYSTTALTRNALRRLEEHRDRPFVMFLSYEAPHAPAEPDSEDRDAMRSVVFNLPDSFDEADVSDKPAWVQGLKPLGEHGKAEMVRLYQRHIATLWPVDRSISAIVGALRDDGRLDRTWLIFLSDNGFSFGEHRYGPHKSCGYEECVRVPMIIAPPPSLGVPPRTDTRLVLNIDLAPTIAEITGVRPSRPMDGQSLVSMITDAQAPWRESAGLELWADSNGTSFRGLVTPEYKYLRYLNGEQELYDLARDPHELTSVINDPSYSAIVERLQVDTERVMSVDRGRLRYSEELLPCLEVAVCGPTDDDDLTDSDDD